MHQGNDYTSQYYYPHHHPTPPPPPNPNPNPAEFLPPSSPFASAPLYYPPSELPNYPPYSQNPDPTPYASQFPHLHQPYYSPYEAPASFGEADARFNCNSEERCDLGLGEGVYAYDGGKAEPYGARGTNGFGSNTGAGLKFDDYGRPLGFEPGESQPPKIVRAAPKMENQEDVRNGQQKFRVRLMPEGASVDTTDVLCQIGLDGIRMLDPITNRTLRIYPLENVTRCEVLDSTVFAFWSKSPVDIDPRRIRLQSNSYTTNTILDTVTAATVQFKEMGGNDSFVTSKGSADARMPLEQTTEKKKVFVDWMNLIKPGNEEKDHWIPDEAVSKCTSCATDFGAFVRKHHCRNCGEIFCDKCTQGRIALTADEQAPLVRVCDRCMAEVSQRLSNGVESTNKKSISVHSHEDLARKLQEEMEKNRKSSSGSSSGGSVRQMSEVACPICTVHLQVQVPSSGSETIECSVCQHPFLVSAH